MDEMTQELLGSESRDRQFWNHMGWMGFELGFDNVYDIEGIEQWIGSPNEEYHNWITDDTDSSSEGEGNIEPGDTAASWQERNERDDQGGPTGDIGNPDKLRSNVDRRAALMRMYGGIDNASLDPGFLQAHVMAESPVIQPYVWSLNPGWGGSGTALAPRPIRSEVPAWLDMQDTGRGIQDVTDNLPLQERTWEALAHRTATQDVNPESGMVIGEILDEARHINDTGNDAVDHKDVEDMGEAGHTHVQHFNWGIWDDESFALHSENLADLNKIGGGSG